MLKLFDEHIYEQVRELVCQFKLTDEQLGDFGIIKAEVLSPDSEAVAINVSPDKTFVLYVEDYIKSKNYVAEQIKNWVNAKSVEFVKPKKQVEFKKTAGAQYYVGPDKEVTDEWAKFTVPSGHDYAFLAEIKPPFA